MLKVFKLFGKSKYKLFLVAVLPGSLTAFRENANFCDKSFKVSWLLIVNSGIIIITAIVTTLPPNLTHWRHRVDRLVHHGCVRFINVEAINVTGLFHERERPVSAGTIFDTLVQFVAHSPRGVVRVLG